MIKSKFIAIACAATLAVTPGLVACGGSSAADSEAMPRAEESTEGTGEETTGEEASADEILAQLTDQNAQITWGAEGNSDDAKYGVLYVETRAFGEGYNMAELLLVDVENKTAKNYHGEFTQDDNGTITLMDTMSGGTITYSAPDADPQTNEVTMEIDGIGGVTLTMADDAETVRQHIVDAIQANDEA